MIIGIIVGALLMMFWQFNVRLNSAINAMTQLQQATAQNTQTVNDVVNFINQSVNPQANNGAPAQASE